MGRKLGLKLRQKDGYTYMPNMRDGWIVGIRAGCTVCGEINTYVHSLDYEIVMEIETTLKGRNLVMNIVVYITTKCKNCESDIKVILRDRYYDD